jgi:hypothetical protein
MMGNWLLKEESKFELAQAAGGASRAARSKKTYSILLRDVTVLDNRRLFGAADIIVYSVVVDGYPDMKSGQPFWTKQLTFANVKDGATLSSIDPDLGVLIYRGRARDFVNLYLLVVRDTQSSRDLAKLLQENFIAQGIGTVAGAAVSIFANLPPQITAPMARELTTTAVDTTLDYFTGQKNLVIGTYYASLLKAQAYGLGLHPASYPASRLNCGGALEIAYQVTRETT